MELNDQYKDQLVAHGFLPMNHEEPNFFPVAMQPVFDGDGGEVEGIQRLVRTDTNVTLKVHTNSYGLVSYQDSFGAFDAALNKSGLDIKGMLVQTDMSHDGARCFRQYVLPAHRIEMPDGEPLALRIIMFNSYDGSMKFRGRAGGYRFVCANTCVLGSDIIDISVKHTKKAPTEILPAIEKIVASADHFMEWEPRFKVWDQVKLTDDAAYHCLEQLPFNTQHLDRMFTTWRLSGKETLLELFHSITMWSTFSSTGENRAATRADREGRVAQLIDGSVWSNLTGGDPFLA